jgi:anhydro-N-acetylmuramic acid kinase
MIVVGLMSGTSADGIDAAVVDLPPAGTRGAGRLLVHTHYPFPAGLEARILRAAEGGACTAEIGHLHAYLGELFAEAALAAIAAAGLAPESVDAIGSHGQTVHHAPEPRPEPALPGARGPAAEIGVRSTLQLGHPAVIAERTGITTVADFRPRDLAAGGQGAPLAPYAHALLFGEPGRAVAVQNLGGIGNVTFIPAGAGPAEVLAFDTGPANMVIDGLVRALTGGRERFDRDGARARRGRVYVGLLTELLDDPYFARRPPKSTGRERFGESYVAALRTRSAALGLPDDDLVATATALTARSIARAYRDFLPARPARVLLCGGGALNATLVAMIRDALGVPVEPSDAAGVPALAVEAVSFAGLARETLAAIPTGLPQVTGASRATVLGVIAPGRRFTGLNSEKR